MGRLYNKVNKKQLKKNILESKQNRTTLSFYKYHPISNPNIFRDDLYKLLSEIDVYGRIYIASEGLNAQISIPTSQLDTFKETIEQIDFLNQVRLNIAIDDDGKSFYLLKIKVKEKIVADGLIDQDVDLTKGGIHIDALTFNKMSELDNTVIVDMRNHYESEVGHFENAICPDVETFRDSLSEVEEILKPHQSRDIIMYCTGGIRCEKATAYFRAKGFDNLYQLDGGIVEYARQVAQKGLINKFRGKNFVFDERLGERISPEIIARCHQCGQPCDSHTNCANDACHLLFIQCASCAAEHSGCCSKHCSNFIQLPNSEQEKLKNTSEFNGSKFGKGRYRAHRTHNKLEHK